MLPKPETGEADLYRQFFIYLEHLEDLVRLRTPGAKTQACCGVEPPAEPEDSENGDAAHCGTALHRPFVSLLN